jgi:hypothetical protein
MISASITTVTTITGFSHIPPLWVAHKSFGGVANYLCNPAGRHHQKSGDYGDDGDAREVERAGGAT